MQNNSDQSIEGPVETAGAETRRPEAYAQSLGCCLQELRSIPVSARVTQRCGTPLAIAKLTEGQTVLDLGCGAGLDAFLAAQRVGQRGRVIGVDTDPELIKKARLSARWGGYENVEFHTAEMTRLPLDDGSVDVVISNCVVNHVREELPVFREIHRVLHAQGILYLSDLVLLAPVGEEAGSRVDPAWAEWLAGASGRDEYLRSLRDAGFQAVVVHSETKFTLAEAGNLLRGKIARLQVTAGK